MSEEEERLTAEIPENECKECRQPAVRKCGECGIGYCAGCEDHWDKCKAHEVCQSSELGIFVKAIRDLVPGEVVFRELPLVVGPKFGVGQEGPLPCVGCCRLITVENLIQCPECFWPICRLECEGIKNNLSHGLECSVLKLRKPSSEPFKDLRFDMLIPLRVLFLQKINTDAWENLLKHLEGNLNTKNDTSISVSEKVEFFEEKILVPLKKFEEETNTIILEQKSSDLLQKIFNSVNTNTYTQTKDGTTQIFYSTASLIPHSCTPNTSQTVSNTPDLKIAIRARSPISKNTHLTTTLIDLLKGTHGRFEDLKSIKRNCFCDRCRDPTEFGTFFSALKCLGTKTEPCGGTQLPLNPTCEETQWVCDTCKIELPQDQIAKFVKHLGSEVAKVLAKERSVEELEGFLEKLLMFLHPNHFHVFSVKRALVRLYGTEEDYLGKKIKLCEELISIAKKLDRGLVLGELVHELFTAKFAILGKATKEGSGANGIQELPENGTEGIQELPEKATQGIQELTEKVTGGIQEIPKKATEGIQELPEKATEGIQELSELLKENRRILLVEKVEEFHRILTEDEAKLDAWLKQKSVS